MCVLSPRPALLCSASRNLISPTWAIDDSLWASRSLEPLCTNFNLASIIELLSCAQPIQAWLLYRQLLYALDSEQQKCCYDSYNNSTSIREVVDEINNVIVTGFGVGGGEKHLLSSICKKQNFSISLE